MTEQRAITAIDAALLEHQGKGVLSVSGKKIVFKQGNRQCTWSYRTGKEAKESLKLLRAAPKYRDQASSNQT